MPIVKADRLTRVSAALLRAAGASVEEADAVAAGCVERLRDGIAVEDATWEKLRDLARDNKLDSEFGLA
ncbi:hypothetical protein [Bradyrhizobium sp. UFLA05-112]